MKKLLCIFSLLVLSKIGSAQFYEKSVGLRLSQKDYGIMYRSHMDSIYALDVTASFSSGSFVLSGLVEREKSVLHRRLFVRAGAGLHTGFINSQGVGVFASNKYTSGSMLAGVRGVVGVEWVDVAKKMIFGIDVIPAIEFVHSPFAYVLVALTGKISIDEAFRNKESVSQ